MTELRSDPPVDVYVATVNDLLVRHFGDGAVVFDPLSWDAHLLNPAAIAVLELLLEAPRSEAEIAAFLADALQAEEQVLAAAHAHRLLGELRSLSLIRLFEAATNANRGNP